MKLIFFAVGLVIALSIAAYYIVAELGRASPPAAPAIHETANPDSAAPLPSSTNPEPNGPPNFRGPSGPPHMRGPSGPPPGY